MSTIRVTLVDGSRGAVMGEADLPPEQLPESFAASTTLHLGDGDWHVERAEPMTRAAYVASGELRLVLRKIEYTDPNKILFSLCTLETTQPPLREGEVAAAALRLHEDDWRQIELVDADAFAREVAAEFADIEAAQATRKGPGFQNLHVRTRIPQPLGARRIALAELARTLGVPPGTVAIGRLIVDGGFAFALDGGTVYGNVVDGSVAAIAATDAEVLAGLARTYALTAVDWCAPAAVRG